MLEARGDHSSKHVAADQETRATDEPDLLPASDAQWLVDFQRAHGRPLRVLHVGNIANNAYLNAKLLRQIGIDAQVLTYDYYHVMSCPEWEEVDIRSGFGNDYSPRFSRSDLRGYARPRWFMQGPLPACAAYCEAMLGGEKLRASLWWRLLPSIRWAQYVGLFSRVHRAYGVWRLYASRLILLPVRLLRGAVKRSLRLCRAVNRSLRLYRAVQRRLRSMPALVRLYHRLPKRRLAAGMILRRLAAFLAAQGAKLRLRRSHRSRPNFADELSLRLVAEFDRCFPERSDRLTRQDIAPYTSRASMWESVLEPFDIVQAYGVDPIWMMLAGKRPYVAFEHGTLRDFTFGDFGQHRLNALAYRLADHVFITNGDCFEHARQLGIERHSAMLHPVDVDQHRRRDERAIAELRSRYGSEVLLFCPLRHDWSVKGTDVHIRALALIRARVERSVTLVVTNWGKDLRRSRALAEELGCAESIRWLPPLCRVALVRHLQAADVVLDQIALPHFGATAPQALAAGTPVVMSYEPESTAYIVEEPAPILSAFTPEEVAAAVMRALDAGWRREFDARVHRWVDSQHHHKRVIRDHLRTYRALLEGAQ